MNNERLAFASGPIEAISLPKGNEGSKKSVTAIFLNGKNQKVLNVFCDAEYLVISGQGSFTFWDQNGLETTREVTLGDAVSIPAGVAYRDEGKMIMISTCRPSFSLNQVKFLEE